ncbi:sugar ABC transporter substrate-binding protein [Nocardia sp. NPDC020380]|uniref:sugar ABC transporter substrate-binding protein n=1 Tax=Nocardia sp. NPDC020380 TaxID=3364309 RepID=UPI00379732B6
MNQPKRPLLRRLLPWAIVLAIMLLVMGCGASGGGGRIHLAFIYSTTSQNPFQEMAFGAKAAAADSGNVDLTENAPPSINGPQEVSQLQAAIRTSRDGIAMETLTPDLFTRPLQQAADAKVPVVAVDTAAPADTGVGLFVGNSNTDLGRSLATEIIKQIPAGTTGEVVLGDDIPGLDLLQQRLDGMKAVLHEQRPTLTVLGPYDSGSEPVDNFTKWNNIVKAHPDAIAFLGAGASDAVSLALIQKNSGHRYLVGSCDPDAQALVAVKDGYVAALASPEHWLKGYIAIRLLAEHARTGKALPQGWWNPGGLIINSANIDQITARQQSEASRKQWFDQVVAQQLADPGKYLQPLSAAN